MSSEVMDTREAAKYLSITMGTMKMWRINEIGPDYIKVNPKMIRYRKADIDKWLESNLQEAGK